jgi:peptide/nickel transport system permease protein
MKESVKIQIDEFKRTIRLVFDTPLGIIGSVIILLLVLSAVFAPFFAKTDPFSIDTSNRLSPPSINHWFGTDTLGRDIYSRIIYGSRYSLAAGIIVVGIAILIGGFIGLLAGYPGGKKGEWIMRITDIFLAFPTLILAIALASTLGPSFINSLIAISVVYWPKYARLVYGQSLSIKESDYVKFAEMLGESNTAIRFRHIYPNTFSAILVQGTLDFGDAILFFAALSFLGLGAQPPAPDWGAMISFAQNYIMDAWWMGLFPGLAIFLVVLGFNLTGDSLRDALDPRLRRLKQFKPVRFTWLGVFRNIFLRKEDRNARSS